MKAMEEEGSVVRYSSEVSSFLQLTDSVALDKRNE
jgi:hypothetical protein